MAVNSIGAFTFSVLPVVVHDSSAGWEINPTLAAATSGAPVYIFGILDPVSTQRIFNPIAEGNPVVQGTDAYSVWLPSLQSAPVATKVTDNLNPAGATVEFGQVQLQLVPAAKNTVEASSVMRFYLSPQALVVAVTAGTF